MTGGGLVERETMCRGIFGRFRDTRLDSHAECVGWGWMGRVGGHLSDFRCNMDPLQQLCSLRGVMYQFLVDLLEWHLKDSQGLERATQVSRSHCHHVIELITSLKMIWLRKCHVIFPSSWIDARAEVTTNLLGSDYACLPTDLLSAEVNRDDL
jgi:hypothetical protein